MVIAPLWKSWCYVENRSSGGGVDTMCNSASASASARGRVGERTRTSITIVWVREPGHSDGSKATSSFIGQYLVNKFVLSMGNHDVEVDGRGSREAVVKR